MNRIPLHSRRPAWASAVAGILGLAMVVALAAWLWRPAKTVPSQPAPTAESTLGGAVPDSKSASKTQSTPTQARRDLAVSGRWSRLSGRDQAILAPLEEDWHELNVDQRQKWLDLALRFPNLQAEEQQRIQERMRQWARMSPVERGAARLNFQEIRQVPAKDRLEQWEAYQGLAPTERKELAVKAQSAGQTPAVPRRAEPSAPTPKSSVLAAETLAGSPQLARPVGGTLVQAPMGATTQLVTQVSPPSGPVSSGPKIAAQPGRVDRATLLPQAPSTRPEASSANETAGGQDDASTPTQPTTPSAAPESAPPATPSTPSPAGPAAPAGGN